MSSQESRPTSAGERNCEACHQLLGGNYCCIDQYPQLDESTLYTQLAMVKQMTAAEELSLDLVSL